MNDFKIGEVFIIELNEIVSHWQSEKIRAAITKILKSKDNKLTKKDFNFHSVYVGGSESRNKSDLWKEEIKKFE
ncbi:MAG: hypothetical protein EHM34_07635 [Nitrosopumilales archaeon]|nr:MAG: hypothetical protein EHM34_07635 [Nitrosopumilales archaeon]